MLIHKGTQPLETERLILRRFTCGDAKAAFENWTNDSMVSKYLTWLPHGNIAKTEIIIDKWVLDYANTDNYNWGITVKDSRTLIGSISVVGISEETESAEIGYCIGREWWNKGFMTEALGAVIKYLFEEIGFSTVRACHQTENPASGKVMLKCGLKHEGVLRKYKTSNTGEIVDMAFYSVLKSEFRG